MFRLGSNATLLCPFENFDTLEWFKDGEPLNELVIELTNITQSDRGKYLCHVSNEAGDNEYVFDVVVYDPPSIRDKTLNQTTVDVIEGTDFTAICQVNGYPAPDVRVDTSIVVPTHSFKLSHFHVSCK